MRQIISRNPVLGILTAVAVLSLPSTGWTACKHADGTPAPEPGPSQAAKQSKTWGPKFVELFSNLSRGDKSVVVSALKVGDAAILTTRCSNHDLFWTHLSLVEMSEVVDSGLPEPVRELTRSYKLTAHGQKALPDLLSAAKRRGASANN